MLELTGKQKRHLRGLAHGLKPVAHIGKHGLTESFLRQLDEALDHHELVKVKFVDFKDEKAAISRDIVERLQCAEAGRVGHLLILFRPARRDGDRKIKLPKAAE
ncbi:MAG: ribosome assembly RNA-binding protein YhbY [Acidobacteriota bacterium]